jgi:hypothetical protein
MVAVVVALGTYTIINSISKCLSCIGFRRLNAMLERHRPSRPHALRTPAPARTRNPHSAGLTEPAQRRARVESKERAREARLRVRASDHTRVSGAQAAWMLKASQPAALHYEPERTVQLGPHEAGWRTLRGVHVHWMDSPDTRLTTCGKMNPSPCARTRRPASVGGRRMCGSNNPVSPSGSHTARGLHTTTPPRSCAPARTPRPPPPRSCAPG